MLQIQGIKSEAVVVYCELLITQEMGYHRLSRRVNKMGFCSKMYVSLIEELRKYIQTYKMHNKIKYIIFLPFCLRSIRVVKSLSYKLLQCKYYIGLDFKTAVPWLITCNTNNLLDMMPKKFAIRYFCNYIKFYVTF